MLANTEVRSLTITVTQTEAYDVVETGHRIVVQNRMDGQVIVFDYTIDAYTVQRHYSDGSVTTISQVDTEEVVGSPFAPFGPGDHWVPDRTVDSVPRDEVTVTIDLPGEPVQSPEDLPDPASFDSAIGLASVADTAVTERGALLADIASREFLETQALIEVLKTAVVRVIDHTATVANEAAAGDPVLIASGRLVLYESDLRLTVGRLPIDFGRTYRSSMPGTGSFGPGWSSPLDARIVFGVEPQCDVSAQAATDAADLLAAIDLTELEDLYGRARDHIGTLASELDTIAREAARSQLALSRYHYFGPARDEVLAEIQRLWALATAVRSASEAQLAALQAHRRDLDDAYEGAVASFAQAADKLRVTASAYRAAGETAAERSKQNQEFVPGVATGDSPHIGNASLVVVGTDGVSRRFVASATEFGLYESASPAGGRLRREADGSYSLAQNDQTILTFGPSGELRSTTDRNGTGIHLNYDSSGQLVEISDTYGREVQLTRDSRGLIIELLGPLGYRVGYSYDSDARLVSVTDAAGDTTGYGYREDRLVRIVRSDGSHRDYGYTYERDQWRVASTTDEEGFAETFNHTQSGRTIHTSAGGVRTVHWYDSDGHPTTVEHADGSWERSYFSGGSLHSFRDGAGQEFFYQYDQHGNVIMVAYPDGFSEVRTYNDMGLVESHTDRSGFMTRFRYDDHGNLTAVFHPDSTAERFTYNRDGTISTYTDRRGNTQEFAYDQFGQIREIVDDVGVVSSTTFDSLGRLLAESDGEGDKTIYEYRADGLLRSETWPTGHRIDYEYDARKDLVSLSAGSAETRFSYDARHLLTGVIHPTGDSILYARNPDGKLVTTEVNGRLTSKNVYDGVGRLTESTEFGAGTTRYEYDQVHRVRRVTDSEGHIVDFTYTWDGLTASRTRYADGVPLVERYTYDESGRLSGYTDAAGSIRRWSFDAASRTVIETDPMGYRRTTVSDPYGETLRQIDELGREIDNTYDPRGRLIEVRKGSAVVADYQYDQADRIVNHKDWAGATTTYVYNDDRSVVMRRPHGAVRFTYTPDGAIESATNELGDVTRLEYDELGRINARVDPTGGVTSFSYDFPSLVTTVTDPTNRTWSYDYDTAGRMVSATDPMGAATWYEYDSLGNVISQTDPTGRRIAYIYDSLSRVKSITRAGEPYVGFEYDAVGNIVAEIDGSGRAHRYSYDDTGNLVSDTNRLGSRRYYHHDGAGRLVDSIDFAGVQGRFDYDDNDNLIAARYSDGTELLYQFDNGGRLLTASNQSESLSFSYTARGNLASATGQRTGTAIGYAYDAAGRRTEMIDHSEGRSVTYRYDAAGRMVAVADSSAGTSIFEYDAAGRQTGITWANGVSAATAYDGAGRVAATTLFSPSGEVIDGLAHVRDAAGRRTFDIDHLGRITAYQYDPAGRISGVEYPIGEEWNEIGTAGATPAGYLSATHTELAAIDEAYRLVYPLRKRGISPLQPVWSQSFIYDANDNRISAIEAGSIADEYRYDSVNQMLYAGDTAFSYDRNGNTVHRNAPGGATTIDYNAAGREVAAVTPRSRTVYEYDALGRRISRTSEQSGISTKTDTRYDGLSLSPISLELTTWSNGEGNEQPGQADPPSTALTKLPVAAGERYLPPRSTTVLGFAGSSATTLFVLSIDGNTLHVATVGGAQFLSSDSHNTIRISTDDRGRVTRRYAYDSFGASLGKAPDPIQPFGFASKPFDEALQWYDFGLRSYSPKYARFATPDPLRDQVNWYNFASVDPVNFMDKLGLLAASDLAAAYAQHYQVLRDAFDPVNRRRSMQDTIRNAAMYQPEAGGNFNQPDCTGLTWCNQATYDYVAATSPHLFRVMTGGSDRTDDTDPSYAFGSDANNAVQRLRDAALEGKIGSTTSEEAAFGLIELGYTIVAAATGEPKGHLTVGRPSPKDGSGDWTLRFSNVGREIGVMGKEQSFGDTTAVEFYYDPNQDRSRFDNMQVLNSWSRER